MKKRKSILKPLVNRLGIFTKADVRSEKIKTLNARNFAGAEHGRLLADWIGGSTSADSETRGRLCLMRNRCRDLERNNDYVARFLSELTTNVIGHSGISMQMRITEPDGKGGQKPDYRANASIEREWKSWASSKNASTTRRLSLHELDKIILRSVGRDGDFIIRIVRGFDNDFKFSIQVLEADYLAEDKNETLKDGNYISMGVELNSWGEPVAYHLYTEHPGNTYQRSGGLRTVRVPASEIIMPFMMHRAGQTRGYPWMSTTMNRLKMLDAYEEAELVKVRASSCKMGFYTKNQPEDVPADEVINGNPIGNFSAGMIEELPMGVDFKGWDPTATDANYGDFRKGVLRGISAGLNCSYNILAQDLEGVNYSSLRGGLLDEREMWMMVQRWYIETVRIPIFNAWLEMALLSGRLNLPFTKIEKFSAVEFRGRRWAWVDPMKDVQAALLAIDGKIKSRREVVEDNGRDIEDVFTDLASEEQMAEDKGISLMSAKDQALTSQQSTDEQPDPEDKDEED